ncbi:MAG: hypothetical protein EHM91_15805, partial [Planctomycetota bacterium]
MSNTRAVPPRCLLYRSMTALLAIVLLLAQDVDALKARFNAEKEKPSDHRAETVAALAALKTDDAAAFLAEIFEKDKDAGVRAAALKGLPLKKLAEVASDSKQQFTFRAIALDALTKPPSKEGLPVAKAVARESGEIRIHAWAGLRNYTLKETESHWRDGLDESDPLIKAMSMMALSPLKEVKLQDVARAALLNPDAEPLVKYASVTVLQVSGGPASTRVFVAAAGTTDPTLRRLLSEALGSMTDDKSAAEIYAALRNADPNVRAVMARSLGRLKHANADDRLSEPLKDKV